MTHWSKLYYSIQNSANAMLNTPHHQRQDFQTRMSNTEYTLIRYYWRPPQLWRRPWPVSWYRQGNGRTCVFRAAGLQKIIRPKSVKADSVRQKCTTFHIPPPIRYSPRLLAANYKFHTDSYRGRNPKKRDSTTDRRCHFLEIFSVCPAIRACDKSTHIWFI